MTVLAASEAYRRWAPTYGAENAFTTIECELADRLSPHPRGLHLLDVGCGTGRRLFATGAASATGVEPCAEMLAAGLRAHAFGPEARLLQGDARAIPLPAAAFDLVWCRLVIGHVPDCRPVLRELARVARPGGRVLVTDFHPAAYAAGMRRTFRDAGMVLEVEHHAHSVAEQVAAAEAAGLTLLAMAEASASPSVRHFYEEAGMGAQYRVHETAPIVLGLLFARDG